MSKAIPLVLLRSATLSREPAAQNRFIDSGPEYRPIVHWGARPIECNSNSSSTFPLAYLQERDDWYGKQLRATGQGSLCRESRKVEQVYRLTWIPSFHPTVMVRIEKRGGAQLLHAVRLSGAGGFYTGRGPRERILTRLLRV